MTVVELMNVLGTLPPNAEVCYPDFEGAGDDFDMVRVESYRVLPKGWDDYGIPLPEERVVLNP